jgi:hypothetical protein
MQSIGFLGPAFFLTQLSHVKTPAMAVLCMACSQVWARSTFFSLILIPQIMAFLCCKFSTDYEALVLIQHIYIWFKYMQPPNSNHNRIFTGIWCILTIWSLFQSPRHWTALCCESLLPKMIMSFNMSISKSSWVSISGSIAGTNEHRRCACRCFWHGCNWIHTPKRSACSPHSFWSLLIRNLYLRYFTYMWFFSLQVLGMMCLRFLLHCT